MVEVILAGYNIDAALIKEVKEEFSKIQQKLKPERVALLTRDELEKTVQEIYEKANELGKMPATPETISAAYARISRDPAPIPELRDMARKEVEAARKSNKKIIFDMGHSSIAEHSVFNLDILGLSRYAVEMFEEMRLASYTEKSQRYVTLDGDYVVPEEIKNSRHLDLFNKIVDMQNRFYLDNLEKMIDFVSSKEPEMAKLPEKRKILEGVAKEDLRYALGFATKTQIGATVNAHSLEYRIRKLASQPLAEARELSKKLFQAVNDVAPSVIKYTEKTDYLEKTRPELEKATNDILNGLQYNPDKEACEEDVSLIRSFFNGDDFLINALLFTSSGRPVSECGEAVKDMDVAQKTEFLKTVFRHIKPYDSVLREFEFPDLIFEMLISASAFAQLKRHRMATIKPQRYSPDLGYTIPESIREVGLEKKMTEVIERSTEAFCKVKKDLPDSAYYFLTNGHRRRTLVKVNAREMYHISRIREDSHAQWDIRDKAHKMVEIAKKYMPLTFMLAAGKDNFDEAYTSVFNK